MEICLSVFVNDGESMCGQINTARAAITHSYNSTCKPKLLTIKGLPWWLSSEESTCNAGAAEDLVSILGLGKSPGGGHGNPLQYFCLENPMDGGAWWAIVHGVTESWTRLK